MRHDLVNSKQDFFLHAPAHPIRSSVPAERKVINVQVERKSLMLLGKRRNRGTDDHAKPNGITGVVRQLQRIVVSKPRISAFLRFPPRFQDSLK